MAKKAAKAAPKKAAAKKAAPKAAAKKTVAKAAAAPLSQKGAISTKYGKSQIVTSIAEATELNRKQVGAVIDNLATLIERHIAKNGAGEFVMPGLFKVTCVKKPATKARKGTNPFTGEEVMFKAKPARTVLKIRPLKKMKEMV